MKNYSLVLSGGGALGFAHIGVLEFLEGKKLFPKEIIGTSMGSIIGTAFACGFTTKEIEKIVFDFHIKNIRNLNIGKLSLLSPKKTRKFLLEIFGEKSFKDCKIDLKIISTKLRSNETVCFSKDNDILLVDAILASCAIPWALPPIKIKNELYIDGYFSSNLAVEFSSNSNVLAIDVLSKKVISDLDIKQASVFSQIKNIFKIYERSIFNQNKKLNRLKIDLLKDKKIILIEPDIKNFSSFDFKNNINELIQIGKKEIENNKDFI